MRHNRPYQNMQFPAGPYLRGNEVTGSTLLPSKCWEKYSHCITKYASRLKHGQKLLKGKKKPYIGICKMQENAGCPSSRRTDLLSRPFRPRVSAVRSSPVPAP